MTENKKQNELVLKEDTQPTTKNQLVVKSDQNSSIVRSNLYNTDLVEYGVYKNFNYVDISTIQNLSKKFIICLCDLIRKQAIERLHIVGDIFDRGPRADLIIDELINYNLVDIEWGNHDIEWIGASLGNDALICTALRNSIRYNLIEIVKYF